MAMAVISRLVLFVLPFVQESLGGESSVTPTEKVTELLRDLQSGIQNESAAEASTYEAFSCFCQSKTATLSGSITSGRDSIDLLAAELADKNATMTTKSTERQEAKTKLEAAKASLKATEVRAAKEKAEYEANDADLRKAISSLTKAITSMRSSKPTARLIAVKQTVVQDPAVAAAMRLLDAGWKKNSAFLQSRVDPNDPAYKYHSNEIIETMEKLHEDFLAKKMEADGEYTKAKAASDGMISDLNSEIGTTTTLISDLGDQISALSSRLAQARIELVEADSQLKDDKLYLTDLTALCEKRAKQWDQRSKMRADELEAISKAISILENVVAGTSAYSARALVQKRAAPAMQKSTAPSVQKGEVPAAFLQRSQVREHKVERMEDEHSREHSLELAKDEHRDKALALLGVESRRLGSATLSAVVARAAADPFAKVKNLIQSLVERLLREATEEASKKGFCDTEMGKATKDRDARLEEVLALNAEIAQLEAKQDELELEIGELSDRLDELAGTANETARLRADDKAENMETLAQSKEGLEAVKEAMGILKAFYKQASKATAFTQLHASPVDEENPGAGFDGNYGGKQAESQGIVGLLEVIKSDFERTIKTTEEAEKEAAAEYVEFDRATKTEQGSKTTKRELDQEDLDTTRVNKQKDMEDMQTNMNLLDAALRELEELKPMCVDNVMSYEERVAKREEEIDALKRALCILDPEGVEAECQTGSL